MLRFQAGAIHLARISTLTAVSICCTPAFAQGPDGDGPPATSWSLGLAVISAQKPYTDIDRETKVLPVLQFENAYIHLFGPQIGLKLPNLDINETQQLNFSIVGKYDGSGYQASDADILGGMRKRRSGFWAGAEVEWKNDVVDVKAAWLADASNTSEGQSFGLGLEKTWHFGGAGGGHMMLTPRMEATWNDKKYVDYYFGVRDNEVRHDRAAYTGKAGTNVEVGLRGIYMLNPQHSLFLDLAVSKLSRRIEDSPLVDSATENRVFLGYTYSFR